MKVSSLAYFIPTGRARHPCLAPALFPAFIMLCLCCIPLGKCTTHCSYQLIRSVVFDLFVNVHRNFTALMSRQVLNRFRVYGRMNQIRNVCMPQLMRCHFKIQTVNHFAVMCCLFTEDRRNRVLYTLSILVAIKYD